MTKKQYVRPALLVTRMDSESLMQIGIASPNTRGGQADMGTQEYYDYDLWEDDLWEDEEFLP